LPGVHLPVGFPDRLELAEGLDELLAEHLRQQLGARLPVAVLSGQRAAEAEHEVGRLVEEAPVGLDPVRGLEVEVPARVDAALAVVAVERALVAVLAGELAKLTQVLADALGRDCRVLPALVGIGLAGEEGGRTEPRLAHAPDVLLRFGIVVELHPLRRTVAPLQLGHQVVGLPARLLLRLAAELDEQPSAAPGQHREVLAVHALR